MSKIFDEHQKLAEKNTSNLPSHLAAMEEGNVLGNVPCHNCEGVGKLNEEECNMCAGTGFVPG